MNRVRLVLLLLAAAGGAAAAPFGTAYPLLGEFSDLALDESRSVLYLANFTASRIDVFSTATNALQQPIQLGINPSAIALSPDNRNLLILNFGSPSLFLLNLDNRSVQTTALPDLPPPQTNIPNLPRAAAFGSDGTAIIVTSGEVLKFDPATGQVTVLLQNLNVIGGTPTPEPATPAEIVNARMAASADRNTLFIISQTTNLAYAFYFSVPDQKFISIGCTTPVVTPTTFASVAPNGSLLFGGGTLFDRQMRILADFVPSGVLPIKVAPANPTAPPPPPNVVIGASEFSRDSSTIYASFFDSSSLSAAPFLYVLDSDNLTIRDRILLPDQLAGKMVSDSAGAKLYALSQKGLTIIPIGSLNSAPRLTASSDTIVFRFNVCNKLTATATFDVVNQGPGSVDFTLSTNMPGLSLSQTSGTTPAHITATFDPNQLFNVKGTTLGLINVSSNGAVNIPGSIRVLANLQDTDQRGTIFVQGGTLRDLLIDELRQRFYILDSSRNQLLVFDLNDFSLKATVRTGYFPLHMAIAPDQKTLLVTNAQSETISKIDLNTLQPTGFVYCPCRAYPRSIAVSTNAILVTTAIDRQETVTNSSNQPVQVIVTEGRMNRVDLTAGVARELATMGIFTNNLSPKSLLTATPSGSRILIAEDVPGQGSTATGGIAKIYDAQSDSFILARAISSAPLKGDAAASDTGLYNAGAVLLGPSLAPLTQFNDAPNLQNGFVFVGGGIVRTLGPATGGGPGLITRVDPTTLQSVHPVKLAEAPLQLLDDQPLRRSLAGASDGSKFITLSSSGFEVIPGSFDAFLPPPAISSVTNSATFSGPVAPGSLISVFGNNLAPLTTSAGSVPLPTFLADACITVNNLPIPLLYLSAGQINGQLPFEVNGAASMVIHTPGGVSDPFNFQVSAAAPGLFSSDFSGQAPTPIPIILRAFNQQPVTPSNPAHRGDILVMFGTGFGNVSPGLGSGQAAPVGALFNTTLTPTVTIGGVQAEVLFSGLAPGFVGLNQLNVKVPLNAPLGFQVPLQITSGGVSTQTFLVRVQPEMEQ